MQIDTNNLQGSLRTLINYVKEDKKTYFIGIFLSVIIGLMEFAGITSLIPAVALFFGEEISGIPHTIKKYVELLHPAVIGVAFAFLILLQTALNLFRETYLVKKMAKWRTDLSIDYIRGISYSEWSGLGKLQPGEVEVMLTRNIGISMKLRHMTANFISDCVLGMIYISIAIFISFYTSILFISLAVMFGAIQKLTLKWRVKFSIIARDKYILIARKVIEYFSDSRTLALSNKKNFLNMLHSHLEYAAHAQKKTDQLNVVFKNIYQPIMLSLFIIAGIIAIFYLKHPASTLLGVLYVFYRAAPRLINIGRGYGEIIGESPVDVVPEIQRWQRFSAKQDGTLPPKDTSIVFHRVNMGYNEKEYLLTNVEFYVNPFELICITGKSGTGKSTILDVICGFHAPLNGSVKLGGIDYFQVDWSIWRNKIGLVRAEGVVVSGAWVDNVAFLYEKPDLEKVNKMLDHVGLLTYVETFPETIHSYIEARGANLSAGQRQRILLARALYREPKLLILDEPTSNLDIKTEEEINQLLLKLKGKMTMIVISHREYLMEQADKIYKVGDDGKVELAKFKKRMYF